VTSKLSVKKIMDDAAKLLKIVQAMERPIFKPRTLSKEERERQRIYELETEQLRWQYGQPEDIDPELR